MDLFTPHVRFVIDPYRGMMTIYLVCMEKCRTCVYTESDSTCFDSALDLLRSHAQPLPDLTVHIAADNLKTILDNIQKHLVDDEELEDDVDCTYDFFEQSK